MAKRVPKTIVGFKESYNDLSLFILMVDYDIVYLCAYVDDIALTSSNSFLVESIIERIRKEFCNTGRV